MIRVLPYGPWLDNQERDEAWIDASLVVSAWHAEREGMPLVGMATVAGCAYVRASPELVAALGLRGVPPQAEVVRAG